MLYQNMQGNMRSQMTGNCGCRNNMSDNTAMYMTMPDKDCDCDVKDGHMNQRPLAMAYVPWQRFDEVYPLDRGFHAGTIFPCLNLPFLYGNPACNRRGGHV